jgi:hypothetical protein
MYSITQVAAYKRYQYKSNKTSLINDGAIARILRKLERSPLVSTRENPLLRGGQEPQLASW